MLIKRKQINKYEPRLRYITVLKIPGSEFPSVNWMLRCNRYDSRKFSVESWYSTEVDMFLRSSIQVYGNYC